MSISGEPEFGQFRTGIPVTFDERMRPRIMYIPGDVVTGIVVRTFGIEYNFYTVADENGREWNVSHSWVSGHPDDWPTNDEWAKRYAKNGPCRECKAIMGRHLDGCTLTPL